MPTSNAVFFTVRPPVDFPEAGWHVRVRGGPEFTSIKLIAEISDYIKLSVSRELSDIGAGSVTLSKASPLWETTLGDGQPFTTLLDIDHLWEAYEDGVLRAQWLGSSIVEEVVTDDEGNDSETVTISGPGAADVLRWAKVFPPGWPKPPKGIKWPINNTTPAMSIFLHLLRRAQVRGTIPWVKPTFDSKKDSGGRTWDDVKTPYKTATPYAPEMGSDLLTQLERAVGLDSDKPAGLRAEWIMWPGWKLDVRPTIGVHREKSVIFYEGNVTKLTRTRVRDKIVNLVVVRDDNGKMAIATYLPSVRAHNRREELQQRGNIVDQSRKDRIAKTVLEQGKNEQSSWTLNIPYYGVKRRPFKDFDVGDWIGISKHLPDKTNVVEAYRVMAITVVVTDEVEAELTLESLFEAKERERDREITKIINTVGKVPTIDIDISEPEGGIPIVYDPTVGSYIPSPGGTYSGGPRVYVSATDPADTNVVSTGDFWLQTF